MSRILVLPDPHAHPEYDNERALWAGRYIVEQKPDAVVCIGDLVDFPSLSSYDKGTKGFEGRRYNKDVAAAIDFQKKLFKPIEEENVKRRRWKEKQWSPATFLTLGNHEYRVYRAINLQPELDGTIDPIIDCYLEDYWDVIVPFKDVLELENIQFSHYFVTGIRGNPIGGEYPAANMLKKNYMSSVQGHSHNLDFALRTRGDGQKICGLVAGSYAHPNYSEEWCRDTVKYWWNGLVMLDTFEDGSFDIETIHMSTLAEVYG